jgi:hypothetical protein
MSIHQEKIPEPTARAKGSGIGKALNKADRFSGIL